MATVSSVGTKLEHISTSVARTTTFQRMSTVIEITTIEANVMATIAKHVGKAETRNGLVRNTSLGTNHRVPKPGDSSFL